MSTKQKTVNKAEGKDKAEQTVKVSPELHAALFDGFKALTVSALNVKALESEASKGRSGNYSRTVELGIAAASFAVFDSEWNVYRDALIANKDGMSVAMGCEPSRKEAGKYTVPSGLSSAVSVVRDALKFGVPLAESRGKRKGEPRPFADIRKDASEAKKLATAKESGTMNPTEQAHAELLALIEKLRGSVSAMTRDDATAAAKILRNLLTVADGSAGHADKAERKAA